MVWPAQFARAATGVLKKTLDLIVMLLGRGPTIQIYIAGIPAVGESYDCAKAAISLERSLSLSLSLSSSFNLDAFKRSYSNEDIATKGVPFFWENFD